VAGRDLANPIAMMLSSAMLLDWLGVQHDDEKVRDAGGRIERAIEAVVGGGTATPDLGGTASTTAFTAAVVDAVRAGA
jgi:3-isopropylmalate dehydrogenase